MAAYKAGDLVRHDQTGEMLEVLSFPNDDQVGVMVLLGHDSFLLDRDSVSLVMEVVS